MKDEIIEDYITNLQEENERLKVKCDFLVGKKMVELDKNAKQVQIKAIEQIDYKIRNEKAIEYIKNDWYELNTLDIEHCINLNKDIRIDLLNILQGSDE